MSWIYEKHLGGGMYELDICANGHMRWIYASLGAITIYELDI